MCIRDSPVVEDKSLPKSDKNRFYYNYDVKPLFHLYVWQGGNDVNNRIQDFEQPFTKSDLELLERTYRKFAEIEIDDKQWNELKAMEEPLNGRIVECSKDQESGAWKLLRFRDDKLNGNHVSVVQKVLESIGDSVSLDDLEQVVDEMRSRWKEREQGLKNAQKQFNHQASARSSLSQQHSTEPEQSQDQPKYVDDDDDNWSDDEPDTKRQKI